MASIDRKIIKRQQFVGRDGSYFTARPSLSHDIYEHGYTVLKEKAAINLQVRRTGRPEADLQIEVTITRTKDNTGTGKKDSTRKEIGSFSLPAHMVADFIKSCTVIDPKI